MNENTQTIHATNAQNLEPIREPSDEFEKDLQEKMLLLQQCQRNKALATCSMCVSLIGCEVRNSYVKAVYNSMSKGQQGSFDFN